MAAPAGVELGWLAKFKLNVWAAAPFNVSSLVRNRTVSGRTGLRADSRPPS